VIDLVVDSWSDSGIVSDNDLVIDLVVDSESDNGIVSESDLDTFLCTVS
jgi:hypothetical protein